jgi:hypothetical protein
LIYGPDELDDNLSFLDAVSNEMATQINVFAAIMENKVLAQRNCRLVVDE